MPKNSENKVYVISRLYNKLTDEEKEAVNDSLGIKNKEKCNCPKKRISNPKHKRLIEQFFY